MFKKLFLFTLILIIAAALSACSDNKDQSSDQKKENATEQEAGKETKAEDFKVDKNKTVATVNGEKIKGSEYNTAYQGLAGTYQQYGQSISPDKMKQQVIDALVRQTLLLQDAEKKGYEASEKKVNDQIAKLKEQFGGEKKFNEALKQTDLTLSQYKQKVSENLIWNKYVEKEFPEMKVTEKEIKEAYDKAVANAGDKKVPELEKVKSTIKSNLKDQKLQKEITKVVKKLKENSEIDVKI